MIKIVYYEGDPEVKIYFKGNSFHEVLSFVKEKRFTYNPELKYWSASPKKVLSVIEELKSIDEVDIHEEAFSAMEKSSNPPVSIEDTGIEYDKTILKSEPLGDYQVDGIKKCLNMNGHILNYDTATGKTYISTVVETHLFKYNYVNKLIIVAIGAVLYNWKRELVMFGDFKEEEIQIVKSQNKEPFDKDKKVLIMTYNTYRILSEYWSKKIRKKIMQRPKENYMPIQDWSDGKCSIILDEVHKIKTPTSKRSKWLMASENEFVHKILLTATLKPKNFLDLYVPVTFLDKNILGGLSFNEFKEDVAELGNHWSKWAVTGFIDHRVKHYEKITAPYISSVDKREVIKDKLADKIRKVIYMEFTGEDRLIYEKVVSDLMYKISEETDYKGRSIVTTKKIQNTFPYALQALSDPLLLLDSGKISEDSKVIPILKKWKFKNSTRLQYCDSIIKDRLEEEPNSKFLIWCTNPATIERLAEYYEKYNPLFIHGKSTPSGKDRDQYRDELISTFEKNKKHQILIANPPTVGVGQNIKASNVSIFWNKSFNYEEFEQAQGRNDRPGGPWKEIYEYNLCFDKSLDVSVEKVLSERKELNSLFSDKKTMSKKNIKDLFEGIV